MKLIPWIVALINRKWQQEFDAMVASLEMENGSEPQPEPEIDIDSVNQPTHLSRKFRPRAKRQYVSKSKKHSNGR
jgi:hypothetical protein